MSASTEAAVVEKVSPPPDSALALRQTASSVKRVQANGMKPTIIEDSESDEDAIVSAKGKRLNNLGCNLQMRITFYNCNCSRFQDKSRRSFKKPSKSQWQSEEQWRRRRGRRRRWWRRRWWRRSSASRGHVWSQWLWELKCFCWHQRTI